MYKWLMALGVVTLMGCGKAADAQKQKLVWADEFDYNGLPDKSKWGYDTGGRGWGNNELQNYTEAQLTNAKVENGHLVITARKEPTGANAYSSARLVTKNKGDWKYGKIEVRAKLPGGRGIWPAIWMLPTDWKYGNWPKSGEIDIMEFVGFDPDSVYGSVHTESYNHAIGTQSTRGFHLSDQGKEFHVYAVEWTEKTMNFLVDGKKYHSFVNNGKGAAAWPFDQRFHLILNIAVGGNWGGKNGVDDAIFPQEMVVDWVRVYQ